MDDLAGPFVFLSYRWIVFLHVASVLALMLAHGASVAVMMRLRNEREILRVQALLELSRGTLLPMFIAFGATILTGILLGLLGHLWDERWMWAAVVVLVLLNGAMFAWGTRPFNALRKAAGLEHFEGRVKRPPAEPDYASLALARSALRPWTVMVVALAALGLLLWLMMFKPDLL